MRAAENRRLIKQLARVREVRGTRLAAQQQARHLAQEAAAEQVRLAEEARRVETESQVGVATRALSGQTEAQPPAVVASTDPPGERPASEPFAGRAGFRGEPDWRVTVLMIMTPGTYGIRRGASIADPVLCTTDGCYVSIGADRAGDIHAADARPSASATRSADAPVRAGNRSAASFATWRSSIPPCSSPSTCIS